MQKEIYQSKPEEDRQVFLRDTCDKIENFSYEKSYTNQDVELFCDRLSKIMIDVRQMEVELTKLKKEFAEKQKPLKIEVSDLLNKIKFRSEMVTEQVYIFIDHERNEVGYYTSAGILVHKRMLKIDEHQRSIMGSMRSRHDVMEEDDEKTIDISPDVVDSWDKEEVEEEIEEVDLVDVEAEFAEIEVQERTRYLQQKKKQR